MANFQLQNRGEIRRFIGPILGIMIDGAATTTTDTSSLIDTKNLIGPDDEFNGREVLIYDAAGSIVDGESSVVSDFAGATWDATCAPVFTNSITALDKYEMWKRPWKMADINGVINQAIINATSLVLVSRVTTGNFTLSDIYEYDWLVPYTFGNDFKAVKTVEYVSDIGVTHKIHDCEAAWDESVDGEVTVATQTTYKVEGAYGISVTISASAEANDLLCTDDIAEVDISDCDQIEIFMRSSVALDAGDIQLLLDDTASCPATPLEVINIPAMLANTNYTHVIDLANPHLDTAIISVGLKLITDKGAMVLYVDRIRAVHSKSKEYIELNPDYWDIIRGASPLFKLTSTGLTVVGPDTEIRLTGWSAPDIFSDDTTDSEINPAYIIAFAVGRLLISHAKSSSLDIQDKASLATYWIGEADKWLRRMTTSLGNVRSV